MKKTRKYILWITALLAVIILVTTASIVADDGFVSPFKSKAEEQAALKASEEFDARQEVEIKKQKEYEASLTSEDRQRIEEEKKAAEEAVYLEKKKLAEVRYAELEKLLEEFDATHDIDNLSEQENIERIAITDEMLDLYGPYIAEQVQKDPADELEDWIEDIYHHNEREFIELGKKVENYTKQGKHDRAYMVMFNMAEYNYMTFYVQEIEKRYLAGEDPAFLLGEIPKWQKTTQAFKSQEETDAFIEEWWDKDVY